MGMVGKLLGARSIFSKSATDECPYQEAMARDLAATRKEVFPVSMADRFKNVAPAPLHKAAPVADYEVLAPTTRLKLTQRLSAGLQSLAYSGLLPR